MLEALQKGNWHSIRRSKRRKREIVLYQCACCL